MVTICLQNWGLEIRVPIKYSRPIAIKSKWESQDIGVVMHERVSYKVSVVGLKMLLFIYSSYESMCYRIVAATVQTD